MEYEAIIVALAGLMTGILGTKAIERLLTAGADRETTAQAAIIELARDAIRGWREESGAVVRLTEIVQAHDAASGEHYTTLTKFHINQDKRLDDMDRRLAALVNVLSSRRQVGE